MTAPFPLSSSVGYSIMGRETNAMVAPLGIQPGDIAIYWVSGTYLDGSGPGGHTAVVNRVSGPDIPAGSIETLESWGHHGPGFHIRQLAWWREFVRVPGVDSARLESMRGLTMRCLAAGIYYYSGPGDNDHDGIDNRADLNDYRYPSASLGVDCSGFVWALFDCAWGEHPTGTVTYTKEQLEAIIAFLKEQDVEHGMAVDGDIDDGGRAHVLTRWGEVKIAGSKAFTEGDGYKAGQDAMRGGLVLHKRTAPTNGYFIDLNGVYHRWMETGGAWAPAIKQVSGVPNGKIVDFPAGT